MESKRHDETTALPKPKGEANATSIAATQPALAEEFGGSGKAEPTRYGDWEVAGRCSDF